MRPAVVVAVLLLGLVACGRAGAPAATTATATTTTATTAAATTAVRPTAAPTATFPDPILITSQTMNQLIPLPTSVEPSEGTFTLSDNTVITVNPATEEMTAIGDTLAERLRPATGYELLVRPADFVFAGPHINLTLDAADTALGQEGYVLRIAPDSVILTAHQPAGLFYGVQTLRQLLPATIESATAQPGPWSLPAGTIRDVPRFAWRGVMLDVARHFFPPADVKRVIDLAAAYKLNRLHLHLSDDQGWRIEIKSWPELTRIGGPHRRMRLLHRLGQHVAARHLEVLALVARVRVHRHHVGDLLGRLQRHVALLPSGDVEAAQLHAGGGLPDAELGPAGGHQVQHADSLGGASRVVVQRDDLADAETDADAFGLGGQGGEEHLRRRAVRVLVEEVVLHRPGVVDAQLVGQHHLLDGLLDQLQLIAVMPRLGQLQLVEHPETHRSNPR